MLNNKDKEIALLINQLKKVLKRAKLNILHETDIDKIEKSIGYGTNHEGKMNGLEKKLMTAKLKLIQFH